MAATNNWSTGLFEFPDIKIFFISWCCYPCQVAVQKASVEGHPVGPIDLIPVMCFPCYFPAYVRRRIRMKFSIQGSFIEDYYTMWCCGPCAASQQVRELQAKGQKPAGLFMDK